MRQRPPTWGSAAGRLVQLLRMVLLLVALLWGDLLSPRGLVTVAAQQQQQSNKKSSTSTSSSLQSLLELEYAVYPVRSQSEAAVIEWGHSAIISALDASVAAFGPQTTDAALLEVETTPVLADPVHGIVEEEDDEHDNATTTTPKRLLKLHNADEVRGNVVVMTNAGLTSEENGVTAVDLAVLAQNSGAAALVLVNVDPERPDDIYRIVPESPREQALADTIDIPVVVISLSSANLLTSATVTETTEPDDIVNHGMPDRYVLCWCERTRSPNTLFCCYWLCISLTHALAVPKCGCASIPFFDTCDSKQHSLVRRWRSSLF